MNVTRRGMLRGAGVMLALPFLDSWRPYWAAAKDGTAVGPPLRMAIYTVTGGTVIEAWKPAEAGKLGKLPSILEPLEPLKDQLTLVSGLSHGGEAFGCAHTTCARKHLACSSPISVDQAAARAVGGESFLPSLEIGMTNHQTKFSYRDGAALPFEMNPHLVFDRMFKGRAPAAPNWSKRQAAQAKAVRESAKSDSVEQSVLDAVVEQAQGLRRDLGTSDKRKLDEYLEGVRSVEKRLAFVEARQKLEADEAAAKVPLPTFPPYSHFEKYTNQWMVWRNPEMHGEYIRIMSDLFVLAFQTDTTRVITAALGEDNAMFPGVVTAGGELQAHALEHNGNAPKNQKPNAVAREGCRQIHTWYTKLFAEMVAKLQKIDEGGSSLLDNCLILYTSYMADGGHGMEDYPTLLVGKAQGTLKSGWHHAYPVGTPVANLYVEMLHRMGAKVKSFGDSHIAKKQAFDGRLPGLG
ncbi:MAG: DUF1552 domain-containing protein [Planctomycetes bacterium]|nr:DUF1552 domain-containing protein [Planctomycetota bacterium]